MQESRNVSKIVENFSHIYLYLTHDWLYRMGVTGGRAGSTRQRQKQGELSTKKICSWSKQATCTTWANCKNRPFLNCSCYVLKQTLLGEQLWRTPLLTQTHGASFNRGIQSAVCKGNLFCFQIFLSLLQDVSLACHSDIGFP